MEKDVVKELSKNMKWYEKIIVRLFWETVFKIYRLGIKSGINFDK